MMAPSEGRRRARILSIKLGIKGRAVRKAHCEAVRFTKATGARESVEQFLARGGTVTICPPAFAVPSSQADTKSEAA